MLKTMSVQFEISEYEALCKLAKSLDRNKGSVVRLLVRLVAGLVSAEDSGDEPTDDDAGVDL